MGETTTQKIDCVTILHKSYHLFSLTLHLLLLLECHVLDPIIYVKIHPKILPQLSRSLFGHRKKVCQTQIFKKTCRQSENK